MDSNVLHVRIRETNHVRTHFLIQDRTLSFLGLRLMMRNFYS